MHESELERIERRLIEVEARLKRLGFEVECIRMALGKILDLLEAPVTYPASIAASITVK